MEEGEGNGKVRRLYRSRKDRMIGGVCGGLAEYLGIDTTPVRLLWVVSVFLFGFGFLLYIIALFIVPDNPEQVAKSSSHPKAKHEWNMAIGVVMLVLGGLLLLGQFDLFDLGPLRLHFFPWRLFWPLALIGVGVFLIVNKATVEETLGEVRKKAAESRIRKSRSDKMIFGVCGGVGKYFRIDSTVLRVLWVIAALFSGGIALLAYIVLAVLLPYDAEEEDQPQEGRGQSEAASSNSEQPGG